MSKTYPNQKTAEAIAKKLSKSGTEHTAVQTEQGWAVVTAAELEAMTNPASEAQTEPVSENTEQPATSEAPAPAESKAQVDGSVTVEVPNVHETPVYLITKSFMGKERWFEKKRMNSFKLEGSTATIDIPFSQLRSRDNMKALIPA